MLLVVLFGAVVGRCTCVKHFISLGAMSVNAHSMFRNLRGSFGNEVNSVHGIRGGGEISMGEGCPSSFWSRVMLPVDSKTLRSRVKEEAKVTQGCTSTDSRLTVEVKMTISLCVRFCV